jgi:hypothetical protein
MVSVKEYFSHINFDGGAVSLSETFVSVDGDDHLVGAHDDPVLIHGLVEEVKPERRIALRNLRRDERSM